MQRNKLIVINGDFLCRNLTGIERFAYEIILQLDKLAPSGLFRLYIPANAKNIPELKNIQQVKADSECSFFPAWEHGAFSWYVKKNKAIPLDFSNVTPFGTKGIVFVHDIYAKLFPQDFSGKRDKLIRAYSCFMYRYAARHARLLLTVSEFSRNQIAATYRIPQKRIHVVPNGWEHFAAVEADDSIFRQFPQLAPGNFYFTLGSLSRRKNLKWIADYAEKHPAEIFAISGKMLSGLVPSELEKLKTLQNIVLLGYVSDGHVKALMQKCRAFVFPSYYEGFGIPPLEALSCGAQIVVSNSASLPEVYGDSAHYIDAHNTDVELSELLAQPVAGPDKILEKYTYSNAAKMLYNLVQKTEICIIKAI